MTLTWDAMRAKEADAVRFATLTPHAQMIDRHGTTEDATCGQCAHLYDKGQGGQMNPGRYFKCLVFVEKLNKGDLGGPRTDWRKGWAACGAFTRKDAPCQP